MNASQNHSLIAGSDYKYKAISSKGDDAELASVLDSQPWLWGVCAPVVGAAAGDSACEEVACVSQEVGCHEGAVAVAPTCYPGWICHTAGYHLLITTTTAALGYFNLVISQDFFNGHSSLPAVEPDFNLL